VSDRAYRDLILGMLYLKQLAAAICDPLRELAEHRRGCEKCNAAFLTGGATPLCRSGLELAVGVVEAVTAEQPRPTLIARIIARLRR